MLAVSVRWRQPSCVTSDAGDASGSAHLVHLGVDLNEQVQQPPRLPPPPALHRATAQAALCHFNSHGHDSTLGALAAVAAFPKAGVAFPQVEFRATAIKHGLQVSHKRSFSPTKALQQSCPTDATAG
eukprot:6812909-Pyramimonas_sp.AAC.1